VGRVLVGKLEVKTTLERPRLRCETNIQIGLKDIEQDGVESITLAHDRDELCAVVNTVTNFV
jgi:phosphopantetheinyl transferase (holo-ACP synthase)